MGDRNANSTAAVVVTYKRRDLLRENISCLFAQTKPCDVYIIDNAGNDGTAEMVSEISDERLHYINTGANLGGAGGFELGAKIAVEDGYDSVWLMDDDTLPNPDALEKLFEADQKLSGNWGWLSSAAFWTDGSICKANIPKTSLFQFVKETDYRKEIVPVKMASFVSLLVKSSVIRELGLPIGEYFIWTDDYEFTGRVSEKYPCYLVPGSSVIHAMRDNQKANIALDSSSRASRYRCLFRNDVHCYRQYGLSGWMYILLKDIYRSIDVLRFSKDSKKEKISIIWQGFQKGLSFHPEINYPEQS